MTWMLNPALTQHKETPMPPCSSQICAQTRITKNEKLRKFTKKIHIVTNSIVKINLSNLPKLSHFREIGEKFRKFNRNPSAFQVENFHTRIFMKEPSTPQQVGQYITGDITIIKQAGGPSHLQHPRGGGSINKRLFYGE